jgi:Flp pilus assembly protein TadG
MFFVRSLLRNESGAVAAVFAFATPVMLAAALLAVDVASVARHQDQLQNIADSSALAGAKELHLYRTEYGALETGVRERALAMVGETGLGYSSPNADVAVDGESATVTVTIRATPPAILLDEFGYSGPVEATAVANAFGSARLCVLALDEAGNAAIRATRIASLDAAECVVQSNSTAGDSISADLLSRVEAMGICSSGGVDGPPTAFSPEAETDCPAIEDPLSEHALPEVGPCNYEDKNPRILPGVLQPGHYCGGLTLGPLALMTARPGEYVFSGGPLVLMPGSSLIGDGVSFRFVDEQSTFTFGTGSIVRLSAPETGPMAGFLFFQDPGVEAETEFVIATDLATKLLGTIYLPRGTLRADVIGLIAAQSAWTVVVADRLDIRGAHLVINSDYGATTVPVPSGVGPQSGGVALGR